MTTEEITTHLENLKCANLVVSVAPPAGDVPLTHAKIDKARKILGYNPKTKIETNLHETVKAHIAYIKPHYLMEKAFKDFSTLANLETEQITLEHLKMALSLREILLYRAKGNCEIPINQLCSRVLQYSLTMLKRIITALIPTIKNTKC